MRKILILCLSLCLFMLTGCGSSKEVKKLTAEDIKTYGSQMKKDPLSGDITLNGIKYSLPVKAQSLVENGWKFNDYADKGKPLKNYYYTDSVYMDDGKKGEDTRITVTLYNTSGSEVKFDDAMLGAINVKNIPDYKNTVVLPKGITLASTYDNVISAYGTPKVDYMKQMGWISYSISDLGKFGQELRIDFDKNTKVIKSIYLKNIPK
ncbi:hypothetical protein RBU49_00160 [Clostridium sp. MB40-C1]|uniref:hypothetical protein n=1 Tax=Clostridium sp. MB40-C1 TaxID=3070996 RepID=UPI0027DEE6DD|nr:hypothetical protein [Clostridium sp. MB40-C1]WMJ80693.1 hypothetical protein RBU49_00160 [Clostridium sp. MB40-C1]